MAEVDKIKSSDQYKLDGRVTVNTPLVPQSKDIANGPIVQAKPSYRVNVDHPSPSGTF